MHTAQTSTLIRCMAALAALAIASSSLAATAAPASGSPVRIGLDGEFSLEGSTSAQAVELGIRVALDEINASGGVLGGRPLELTTRDNRGNPARGVANLIELAAMPDLVAVFGGRLSPVMMESLKPAHDLRVPLLAPWAGASGIIEHGLQPSYAFRLAAHDTIAMPAMIERAQSIGRRKLGLILVNTGWGRSNREVAERQLSQVPGVSLVGIEWYNAGETSLLQAYSRLVTLGAQAILLAVHDREGAGLVREVAALNARLRVPLIAHSGVIGGEFLSLAGAAALSGIDFSAFQTFNPMRANPVKLRRVTDVAGRVGGLVRPEAVVNSVGFGNAYDLTHILACAVNLAGSTDRATVRDALEQVRGYDGLVRKFERPFTPDRHDALHQSDLFFSRFRADGELVPIARASVPTTRAAARP